MHQNTVIIVCGPTAVGKTSISIHLAQALHTEIISADSRQCFRELNIGVAKPSPHELAAVPHHFISSHTISEDVNAAVFEAYALKTLEEIFEKRSVAIVCGGTGLYIKAFCQGLDVVPEVPQVIREKVLEEYRVNGLAFIQAELQQKDRSYHELGEHQNPQRMMRALEVVLATGRSVTEYRTGNSVQRPFNIIKIGLELPREILYERINNRVDTMMTNGLPGEVKSMQTYRHLNALQTVGYRELFDHFDGKISLETATETIKQNTRHYAKRQLTWFKKDIDINWFRPNDIAIESIRELLNDQYANRVF